MKVKYSKSTQEDFRKHRDYLTRTGKSDGHKYQKYELDGISKSLKSNISKGLTDIKEHKDSIFPKEFEYHSDSHKMYVDKKSHHIVFYKVITPKKGEPYISVEKCIHSTELRKELEKRGIKPLKGCDKSLLDDLETVYREDDVKSKEDSDEELEVDKDSKKDPRKIWKRRPKENGKGLTKNYYNIHNPESSISQEQFDELVRNYEESNESLKDIKNLIIESNIISLSSYLNERLSC